MALLYAIPALVSFLCIAFLAVYVLWRNPGNRANQLFAIGAAILAGVSFFYFFDEFMTPEQYTFIALASHSLLVLLVAITAHFSCVFPALSRAPSPAPGAGRWMDGLLRVQTPVLSGVYLLSAASAVAIASGMVYRLTSLTLLEFGYQFEYELLPLFPLVALTLGVGVPFVLARFGASYLLSGSHTARRQILLFVLGLVLSLLVGGVAPNILFKLTGRWPGELGDLLPLPLVVLTGYAVKRHGAFVSPAPEAVSPQPPKYTLRGGRAYLLPDPSSQRAHEIFGDLTKHGRPGLCLTRDPPRRVREQMGLTTTPIVWMGSEPPEKGIRTVNRLDDVANMVKDFIREAPDAVVLLDGAAYMVHRYEFQMYFWLVTTLKEVAGAGNGILLVRMDPRVVSEKERAMLENELQAAPAA
ncbi:MAG: DUF835 domain-containing protein [Euryarchaeota archaeon]|nr:DUF835 domain-containing protein [Euryarchaeota archaeon]